MTSNSVNISPQYLFHGDLGYCYLLKNAIPNPDYFFREILLQTPWRNEVVVMMGKQLTLDRKVASYGDSGREYHYSGKVLTPENWSSITGLLKQITEQITGLTSNFVVFNHYANGNEYIGWHSDKEADHLHEYPIISISLGASRDFMIKPTSNEAVSRWKSQHYPNRLTVELSHGDILVMGSDMQKHFKHTVPKRAHVTPIYIEGLGQTTTRINGTFRMMRDYTL